MKELQKQMYDLCSQIMYNTSEIMDLEDRIAQDKADIRAMKRDNRIMNRQLKKLVRMEGENEYSSSNL